MQCSLHTILVLQASPSSKTKDVITYKRLSLYNVRTHLMPRTHRTQNLLLELVAFVIFDIDLHEKQLEKGTSARLLLNGPLGLLV